jgi:hypothetical protein
MIDFVNITQSFLEVTMGRIYDYKAKYSLLFRTEKRPSHAPTKSI